MALIDAYAPLAMHGTTGATAATRYVGGTASGAPVAGTWNKGDYIIAQDGHVFVCTVAGTPGTWTDIGFGGSGITQLTGDVTAGPGSGSQAATLAASGVTAATYGDSTHVGQVVVDAKGRVTSASNVLISGTAPASGGTLLVYRYTVAGSDKTSIDTGVDTPDAGSNDWTNGDLLKVSYRMRTDEASLFLSFVAITWNNDTGATQYDVQRFEAQGTGSFSAVSNAARANNFTKVAGASSPTGVFGVGTIEVPRYNDGVANMNGTLVGSVANQDATNAVNIQYSLGYRSTTALSRVKFTPLTGGSKLKVGSMIEIHKFVSS